METLLSPAALLASLRRRWWLAAVGLVAGIAISTFSARRLPKVYMASTLILVEPQKIPIAYVRPTVTTSIEARLRSLRQQITSRSRIERVIEDLNLFPDKVGKVPMERLVATVVNRLNLEIRGTATFRIIYEGTDPREVAEVANKVADLFIEENSVARQKQARGTSEFLDEELERVRVELEQQEDQLAKFKRVHMGELPEQRETNLRTVEALQNRLRTSSESLARARDRRVTLEAELDDSGPGAGTDVNQLARVLEEQRSRLQDLLSRYTEKHPDVVQLRREIASTEAQLREQPEEPAQPETPVASPYEVRLRAELAAVEQEIEALEKEQEQIKADVTRYQERVENAPKNEAVLSRLTRDNDNLRANYNSLLQKKLEAGLAEKLEHELQGEQFIIVDRAVPPAVPFKPNVGQIIGLGSVLGMVIGACIAIGVDLVRPRFRSEQELTAAYGIPVLASVPLVSTELIRRRHKTWRRVLVGSGLVAVAIGVLIVVLLSVSR